MKYGFRYTFRQDFSENVWSNLVIYDFEGVYGWIFMHFLDGGYMLIYQKRLYPLLHLTIWFGHTKSFWNSTKITPLFISNSWLHELSLKFQSCFQPYGTLVNVPNLMQNLTSLKIKNIAFNEVIHSGNGLGQHIKMVM